MKKIISVIVPCYNVENILGRCMDSLINQTIGFDKIEVILVNDASSDGTWNEIKTYENQYPDNIIAVNCEHNGRQGTARNIGMYYATAEYIGFVDSDDWIENDMYQIMYDEIIQSGSEIVCCKYFRDNGKEEMQHKLDGSISRIIIDSKQERKKLITSNYIGYGVWDKLYKRQFIVENNILFPENVAYEDIYFSSLYYMYVTRLSVINYELYHYYINDFSTVLNKNELYHYDIFEVMKLRIEEYYHRNFINEYYKEIEYDMLMSGYFATLKIMFLRFDKVPYDMYLQLIDFFNKEFPDIINNIYVKNGLLEKQKILLELLKSKVSEKELNEIALVYRNTYKNN